MITELAGGRIGSGHLSRFDRARPSDLANAGYRSL